MLMKYIIFILILIAIDIPIIFSAQKSSKWYIRSLGTIYALILNFIARYLMF